MTMLSILFEAILLFGALTPTDNTPIAFHNEEILSSPSKDRMTLSVLPAEAADIFVQYGRRGPGETTDSAVQRVRSNALGIFVLESLQPDSEYTYRVWCKRPYEKRFQPRVEYSFRTLREADDVFSFAYVTDTHAYTTWTNGADCSPIPQVNKPYLKMIATLDNIRDRDVDFTVLGGDWAMLSCGGSCMFCLVDGQSPGSGSVVSQLQADLRYRKTFAPDVLGGLLREVPFVGILGDHEGEGGYQLDTNVFAREARRRHLPNPYNTYGGDPEGRYYAFRTGPVLIVVIDVMAATGLTTGQPPATPTDWTLGLDQMRWLEATLQSSSAPWKLVFAEHLVGGEMGPTSATWKGRGSIKATLDDTPAGQFKGEQAIVHALMKMYGAQAFFSGNDHVATIGEKQDENGVGERIWYILGGRAGGKHPWVTYPDYINEMDFDGDGIAEYNTDVTGTLKEGFFCITVQGDDSLLLEYVRTHINNPALNNTVLFSHTIFH